MKLSDIAGKLRELADSILGQDEPEDEEEPDEAEKAVWSTAYVNNLPNSAFLFVEPGDDDEEGKRVPRTKRHLPYKDASGAIDMPHLRNAIARMPQMDAVPGLDKEALQKRAQAMLERMSSGSKDTHVAIYKQADGAYRWFGWVSNHFRDRDNPPEILSSGAHQRFVQIADEKQAYPQLWLWHVPGSRVGKADWLEFADGFLMASGTFDKGKEAVAERLAASSEPLTMSHGFYRLKAMDQAGVTDAYWMFEASILPEGTEANPWTRFTAAQEVNVPINEAKKAFLGKFLDASTISQLEADTEGMRKAAEAAGVDWKEVEGIDTPAATEPTIEATANVPTLDAAALTDAVADRIAERLQLKSLDALLTDLKATVEGQGAAIEALKAENAALKAATIEHKKSDDEKVAAALQPKIANVFTWANYRPSASKDNIVDKDNPADAPLVSQKPYLAEMAEKMAATVLRGGTQ